MSDTQRNLLILAAIALVVAFTTTGQLAFVTLGTLVNVAFIGMLGAAMWVWHRNKSGTISAMDSTTRLVLQSCGIVFYFNLVAGLVYPGYANRGGIATVAFFVVLAATAFGMYWAWQRRPGW